MIPLDALGSGLAVIGSLLAIIGALYNNLKLDHRKAMEIWMVSNLMLVCWAGGYLLALWNGGLSVGALFVSYCVYAASNYYGLTRKKDLLNTPTNDVTV